MIGGHELEHFKEFYQIYIIASLLLGWLVDRIIANRKLVNKDQLDNLEAEMNQKIEKIKEDCMSKYDVEHGFVGKGDCEKSHAGLNKAVEDMVKGVYKRFDEMGNRLQDLNKMIFEIVKKD